MYGPHVLIASSVQNRADDPQRMDSGVRMYGMAVCVLCDKPKLGGDWERQRRRRTFLDLFVDPRRDSRPTFELEIAIARAR